MLLGRWRAHARASTAFAPVSESRLTTDVQRHARYTLYASRTRAGTAAHICRRPAPRKIMRSHAYDAKGHSEAHGGVHARAALTRAAALLVAPFIEGTARRALPQSRVENVCALLGTTIPEMAPRGAPRGWLVASTHCTEKDGRRPQRQISHAARMLLGVCAYWTDYRVARISREKQRVADGRAAAMNG